MEIIFQLTSIFKKKMLPTAETRTNRQHLAGFLTVSKWFEQKNSVNSVF
jgi:hypothetical protein